MLIDIDLYFLIRKHEVENECEEYNLLVYEVYSFSKSVIERLVYFLVSEKIEIKYKIFTFYNCWDTIWVSIGILLLGFLECCNFTRKLIA